MGKIEDGKDERGSGGRAWQQWQKPPLQPVGVDTRGRRTVTAPARVRKPPLKPAAVDTAVSRALRAPASGLPALLLICLALLWLPSSPALGNAVAETPPDTEDMFGSVTSVAKNLRLTNVPGPIDVRADRLEIDFKSGRLEYRGSVRVKHAGATITADQVVVTFTPGSARALKEVTARGSVHVVRGEESAYGELAVYDPGAATIILSHNAKLGSGPNVLTGERVIFYIDEQRAVVESGEASVGSGDGAQAGTGENAEDSRVRVVIVPDSLGSVEGFDLSGSGPSGQAKGDSTAAPAPARSLSVEEVEDIGETKAEEGGSGHDASQHLSPNESSSGSLPVEDAGEAGAAVPKPAAKQEPVAR